MSFLGAKIKGAEYQLAKIFSSDFDYDIPSYQRPYAWTTEEAGILYDDLYDFFKTEKDENYFLGSIVLIKEEDKPHADVIDGQQRLTTLTILFAIITSKLSGEKRAGFKGYIIEPGNEFEGISAKPRLRLRKRDNEFFEKYVHGLDFDNLIKLDVKNQDTEAKVNIIENAKVLIDKINNTLKTEEEIVKFASFLVRRCYLVAVSTPSEQSAFRVFSVMNSRGMSLLATDIIKADVIGALPEFEQQKYNDKWEEIETELGRNGFNDLFSHIRMIKMKVKAKKSLKEEFLKYVLPDINSCSAKSFIENVLEPYSEAYSVIKNCAYMSSKKTDEVNNVLAWLNRIDNSDWVPVAILFCVKNNNSDEIYDFLFRLERLAAFMRALSWDINHRIERYALILNEIENSNSVDDLKSLDLTDDEVELFIDRLDDDVYKMTANKRNYLILRLDSFVSNSAAKYDSKVLTIEHVLPQTVKDGSQWEKDWEDVDARSYWVHKIANLVPLTKRQNSEAQNYDFDKKKEKYFRSKTGVSAYALTTQVLTYNEWTPQVVAQRQKELIDMFKKGWNL